MNTKAFVNGFDPDNTVKGYYDENDQLVLVEPEGSGGGGGELRTVTMTVTADIGASAALPKVAEGPDGTDYIVCISQPITAGTYKLAATESGGAFTLMLNNPVDITGDAELDDYTLLYTGDFTITPAVVEGE